MMQPTRSNGTALDFEKKRWKIADPMRGQKENYISFISPLQVTSA